MRPPSRRLRRTTSGQLDADLLLVTDRRGALLAGDYNGAVAEPAAGRRPKP